MVLPSDDFDRERLKQIHATVELLVKQVARMQSEVHSVFKRKEQRASGRQYLRNRIRALREEVAKQKLYIVQLENELRLKGLE